MLVVRSTWPRSCRLVTADSVLGAARAVPHREPAGHEHSGQNSGEAGQGNAACSAAGSCQRAGVMGADPLTQRFRTHPPPSCSPPPVEASHVDLSLFLGTYCVKGTMS